MSRYAVFSVTGYDEPATIWEGPKNTRTTWYVADTYDMGRVVARYDVEHEARRDAFRSNVAERRWEKEQDTLHRRHVEELLG